MTTTQTPPVDGPDNPANKVIPTQALLDYAAGWKLEDNLKAIQAAFAELGEYEFSSVTADHLAYELSCSLDTLRRASAPTELIAEVEGILAVLNPLGEAYRLEIFGSTFSKPRKPQPNAMSYSSAAEKEAALECGQDVLE